MSIQYPAGTGFDPRFQRPKGQNVGQVGNIYMPAPPQPQEEEDKGIDAGTILAGIVGAAGLAGGAYLATRGRNIFVNDDAYNIPRKQEPRQEPSRQKSYTRSENVAKSKPKTPSAPVESKEPVRNIGAIGNTFVNLPGIKKSASVTSADVSLTDVQKVEAQAVADPVVPPAKAQVPEPVLEPEPEVFFTEPEIIGYEEVPGQEPKPIFSTPRRYILNKKNDNRRVYLGTPAFEQGPTSFGTPPEPITAPDFKPPGTPISREEATDQLFAEAAAMIKQARLDKEQAAADKQIEINNHNLRREALRKVIAEHVNSTTGHVGNAIKTLGKADRTAAFQEDEMQLFPKPIVFLGSIGQGLASYPEGLSDAQKRDYSFQLATKGSLEELTPDLQSIVLEQSPGIISKLNNDYGRQLLRAIIADPDFEPAPKGQGFVADDRRRKTRIFTTDADTGEVLSVSDPMRSYTQNNSDLSPLFKRIPGRDNKDIDIADSSGLDFSLQFDTDDKGGAVANQPGALLGYNTGFDYRIPELGDIAVGSGSGGETVMALDEAYAVGAGGGNINVKNEEMSIEDKIKQLYRFARGEEKLPEARVSYDTVEYGENSDKYGPDILPTATSLVDALVRGNIKLPSEKSISSPKYDGNKSSINIPSTLYGQSIDSLMAASLPFGRYADRGVSVRGIKIGDKSRNKYLNRTEDPKLREIGLEALVAANKHSGNLVDSLMALDGDDFLESLVQLGDNAFTSPPTELQKRTINVVNANSLGSELQKVVQLGYNLDEANQGARLSQVVINNDLSEPYLAPGPDWEDAQGVISGKVRRYGQPTILKFNKSLIDMQPDPAAAEAGFIDALNTAAMAQDGTGRRSKSQAAHEYLGGMLKTAYPDIDDKELEQAISNRLAPYGRLNPVKLASDPKGKKEKYNAASILSDRAWKDLMSNYKGGEEAAERLKGVPIVVQLGDKFAQPIKMQVPVTRSMSDAIGTILKMEQPEVSIPYVKGDIEGMAQDLLATPTGGKRARIGGPKIVRNMNKDGKGISAQKFVQQEGVFIDPQYTEYDAEREFRNLEETAKSYGDALATGAKLRAEAEEQAMQRNYEKKKNAIGARVAEIEGKISQRPPNQAALLEKEMYELMDKLEQLDDEFTSGMEDLRRSGRQYDVPESKAVSGSIRKDKVLRKDTYINLARAYGFDDDEINELIKSNELEEVIDLAHQEQGVHAAPSATNRSEELVVKTASAAKQRADQMRKEGKTKAQVEEYLNKVQSGLFESVERNKTLEQNALLKDDDTRTTYVVNPTSIDTSDLSKLPYGSKVTRNSDGSIDKIIVPAVGGASDRDKSKAFRKYGDNTYGIQMTPKDYLDYNVPATTMDLGDYSVQDSYEVTKHSPLLLQAVETFGALEQGDEAAKFLTKAGSDPSYVRALSSLQRIRQAEKIKRQPNPERDRELLLKKYNANELDQAERLKVEAQIDALGEEGIRREAEKIRNRLIIGTNLGGTEKISEVLDLLKNPNVEPLIRYGGNNILPLTEASIEAATLTEGATKKSGLLKEFLAPFDRAAAMDAGVEVSWKDRQNQDSDQAGYSPYTDARREIVDRMAGKTSTGEPLSIDASAPVRHQLGQLLLQDPNNNMFFEPGLNEEGRVRLNDRGRALIAADESRKRDYGSVHRQTMTKTELDPDLADKVYPGDRATPPVKRRVKVPNLNASDPSQGSNNAIRDFIKQMEEDRRNAQGPATRVLTLGAALQRAATDPTFDSRRAGKAARREKEGNTNVAIGVDNSGGTYVEWDEKKGGYVPVAGAPPATVSLTKRQVRDIQYPGGIYRPRIEERDKVRGMNRQDFYNQVKDDQRFSGGRLMTVSDLNVPASYVLEHYGMSPDELVSKANEILARDRLPAGENVYLPGVGPVSTQLPETIGDLDLSQASPMLINGYDLSRAYYPHGRNLGTKTPTLSLQGNSNVDLLNPTFTGSTPIGPNFERPSDLLRAIGVRPMTPAEITAKNKHILANSAWSPAVRRVGLQSSSQPKPQSETPKASGQMAILDPSNPNLTKGMARQRRIGQVIQRLSNAPRSTNNGIVITDLNNK